MFGCPDGANEFEYDDNARLFNAPGSPAEIFSSIVNQARPQILNHMLFRSTLSTATLSLNP